MLLRIGLSFLLSCLLCVNATEILEKKDSASPLNSVAEKVFSDSYEYSVGNLEYYRPFLEAFYENFIKTSIPEVRAKRTRLMETSRSIFKSISTGEPLPSSPNIPYTTHRVWVTSDETPYDVPAERLKSYFETLEVLDQEVLDQPASQGSTGWNHYFWCLDKSKIPTTVQTIQNSGKSIQIRELKEIWPAFRGKDVFQRFYEGRYYTAISDLVRFNLLDMFGGVYSDFGVMFKTNLTPFVKNYDYLFGQEGFLAGTSFLAAPAHSPVMNAILTFIDTLDRVPPEFRNWGDHIVTPRWTALGILTVMMDTHTRESDRILPIPYGEDSIVVTNHMASWLGNTPQFGQASLQKKPITQETFFGTSTIFDNPYRFDPKKDPLLNFTSDLAKLLYNIEPETLVQKRAQLVQTSKEVFYAPSPKITTASIPHISHRCWITNPQKPSEAPKDKLEMYINSLKVLTSAPDWQHLFWCLDPTQIPETINFLKSADPRIQIRTLDEIFPSMRGKAIFDALFQDNRYCNANDITRLNILSQFGGLYADLGFTFHKDLTPFLDAYDRIFLLYDWGNIDHNLAGVKKHDPIIERHLDTLDKLHLLPDDIKALTPDAYSQMVWTGSHHFMTLLDIFSNETDKILFLPSDNRFITQVRGQSWGQEAKFGNKPITQSDVNIFTTVQQNRDENLQNKRRVYTPKWSNPYNDYTIAMNGEGWTNIGEFLNGEMLKTLIPSFNRVSSPLALKEGDIYLVEATNVLHQWHPEWAESIKNELKDVDPKASVVVVSVGTHAPNLENPIEIHPRTIEILKEILSRSKSIGVRGDYTKKILESYGLTTTAVGSYTLLGNAPHERLLTKKDTINKVAITAAFDSFNPLTQHALMAFAVNNDATYIATTEKEMLQWPSIPSSEEVLNRLEKFGKDVSWDQLTLYSRYIETNPRNNLLPEIKKIGIKKPYFEDFVALIQKKIVTPKNFKDWLKIAAEQDLIVSARFEGVIAGLLAGTRSLCIAHDSYTQEACETMHIPYVKILNPSMPLEEVYNLADPSQFISHYETYKKNYYQFLEENNVPFIKTANPFADHALTKSPLSEAKVFCERWNFEPYYDFSIYHDASYSWNIGEILFAHSAKKLFPNYAIAKSPTDLRKGDAYLIVVSNVLKASSEKWTNHILKNLEQVNPEASIVVLCMGAQAPSTDTDIELPPSTVSLLETIAKRSKSIGIRGSYTQKQLERYGITSARIVGCPSVLFNPLPVDSLKQTKESINKIAVGATLYSDNPVIQHSLLSFALAHQADYIIQTEQEFLEWKKLDSSEEVIKRLENFSQQEDSLNYDQTAVTARYLETKPDHPLFKTLQEKGVKESYFKEFADLVRARSMMPKNVQDWIQSLKSYDLIVSSRIHGVITGLLAGTRSLCIAHDSRTQELCETLKIPYLTDFDPTSSPKMYYDLANPEKFLENYPLYKENYLDFFKENGLPVSLI